jgi:pimeloyl-ACP methyl ester carboxylesterase
LRLPSGIELAFWQWDGEGPVVVLHHGTGFCAATWWRVARALAPRFHVVAFDARGHGDSDKPPGCYRWEVFSQDVCEFVASFARSMPIQRPILAVGHSFGGAVVLHVAHTMPDLFGAVMAIEPVLLSAADYARQGVRADGTHPLSIAARMRQARFASLDAARGALGATRTFAEWDPAVFEDYLEHAFHKWEGGAVELKCSPSVEAALFEMGPNEHLFGGHEIAIPTRLHRATRGWFPRQHYARLARILRADTRLEEVSAGHLVPMERPEETARSIATFAEEL